VGITGREFASRVVGSPLNNEVVKENFKKNYQVTQKELANNSE
jgi:hypothetical protein